MCAIRLFCALTLSVLSASCSPSRAQHRPSPRPVAIDASSAVAASTVIVPHGFTALPPPTPGVYRGHVARHEHGYPTMEIVYSRGAEASVTLSLVADGSLTLDIEGSSDETTSRSRFAGGRLPDGAPGNETHNQHLPINVHDVGCWRNTGRAIALRFGQVPWFRCEGDAGAPVSELHCVSVDGAPVGLRGTAMLVCQPPRGASTAWGTEQVSVMVDQPMTLPRAGIDSFTPQMQWLVLGSGAGLVVRFDVTTWSVRDLPKLSITLATRNDGGP